jgi:hypothetical protein
LLETASETLSVPTHQSSPLLTTPQHRVPAVYGFRAYVAQGALMSEAHIVLQISPSHLTCVNRV